MNFSASDLVDVAAKHANDFSPGKGWHYSNTGYVLAGMIAEKVIGESIHDYLDANILGSTHFNLLNTYSNTQYSETVQQQMVHGYGLDNQGNLKDMTSANDSWANAAGDMRANTRDLVRWVRILFGGKVLNKIQMDEMQTVVCPSAGLSCMPGQPTPLSIGDYGLGIVALHDAIYGTIWDYTGGTLGYSFNYIYVPSDNIVISVAGSNTNSKDDYTKMLSMQILSIVDQKHNHASVTAQAWLNHHI
jgi:D-alanyl-D-alanine carboxypeptidase